MRGILTINSFIYINGKLFELSHSKVTSLLLMPDSSWSMIPVNGDEFLLVRKICLDLWFPGTFMRVHTHTHTQVYICCSISCKPLRNTNQTDTMARDSTLFSYQESHSPVFTHIRNLQAEQTFFFSPVCFVVWLPASVNAVVSLFQVKYKANPLHMAAVICNCLREERRILSTASMQEQVLPRHVANSMQKPQIPRTMLLTKLQSFALTWYYSIPVWDPNSASVWPS